MSGEPGPETPPAGGGAIDAPSGGDGGATAALSGGAPIRALVTVIGLDQHEAGSLAVARLLRDAGVEVIYTGRFQLPETIADIAVQEDVDVVGVSAHSWEFLKYADELVERLGAADPPIPIAVGGSVITDADRHELIDKGIDAAVPPTATEAEIVEVFRALARGHRAAAA